MRFLFSLLLWHSCFIIVDERPNRKTNKRKNIHTKVQWGRGAEETQVLTCLLSSRPTQKRRNKNKPKGEKLQRR